jgi:hypothetical protein
VSVGRGEEWDPSTSDYKDYKPDTAEHVAETIVETIETGQAEVLAYEWMSEMGEK